MTDDQKVLVDVFKEAMNVIYLGDSADFHNTIANIVNIVGDSLGFTESELNEIIDDPSFVSNDEQFKDMLSRLLEEKQLRNDCEPYSWEQRYKRLRKKHDQLLHCLKRTVDGELILPGNQVYQPDVDKDIDVVMGAFIPVGDDEPWKLDWNKCYSSREVYELEKAGTRGIT